MHVNRILLLGLLCLTSTAWGQRRIVVPPYVRRLVLDNPPAFTVNPALKAGTNIHVSLFLTNVSNQPQSGTVKFMPGTTGYAAWNTGFGPYFDRHLYVCTGTDAAGATSTGPAAPNLPRAANWTLAANQTKLIAFGMAVRSPCTVAPSLIDTQYSPIIEVIVTEDRGAILGALLPQIDGAAAPFVTCDGTNFAADRDIPIPNARSGNPLFVNGGRPF